MKNWGQDWMEINIAGGINTYGYAEGAPTAKIDPTGLEACPGGIWDEQKADWGLSLAAGGFFSSTNVNYVCRSKPSLKVSGKQTCIGGGPILGVGFGGTLGGTAYGADDSSNLGGWARHQGQFSFGPISVQAPVNGDAGGSVSIGKSIGGGAAYSSCYTKITKTTCEAPGK